MYSAPVAHPRAQRARYGWMAGGGSGEEREFLVCGHRSTVEIIRGLLGCYGMSTGIITVTTIG